MQFISNIKDKLVGKIPSGSERSPHWEETRKLFLQNNPICKVCGNKKNLQVHHKQPFHLHPELELDPSNLITLCEGRGKNDHLLFGHLRSFKSYNETVEQDADTWRKKIFTRPDA
jgi:5-methylcytosine-specific restriction endonuclease McrA